MILKSDHAKYADDWSRDGRFILYRDQGPTTGWDLWLLPLGGDRKPVPIVQTPFTEFQGALSPDGAWVAYTSDETGRAEVYVQTVPPSGGKWQISTSGGVQPKWRRDGRELYFHSAVNEAMAVDVIATGGEFRPGVPRSLFPIILASRLTERNTWDVDARRPAVPANSSRNQAAQTTGQLNPITVVVNWLAGQGRQAQ